MTIREKRLKIKFYRFFGYTRCRPDKKVKNPPPIDINDAIGIDKVKTTFPLDWKQRVSIVCQDGTILEYNPVSNQQATDEALAKLKKETIKGQSLNTTEL